MLSPTLILTLFIAADTAVNRVYATIDIENIVRTLHQLQQQQQNEKLQQVKEKNRDESESENEFLTFGSLKPQEVENLIQSALKEVAPDKTKYIDTVRLPVPPAAYKEKDTSDEISLYSLLQAISNRPDDDNNSEEKIYIPKEPERNNKIKQIKINSYIDQINKLLPESKSPRPKQISKKKRLQPNDLLGDVVYSETANRAEPSDLNDYSKVYVILNVDAIQQTKMRNRLSDLVYSLLQSPPRPSDYREQNRQHRYKGFLINDDYRRAGKRHSGEVYPKKEISMDYKPKSKRLRSRDHGGGGGGGGGGRTPIPYIRNRGDIYEKEN